MGSTFQVSVGPNCTLSKELSPSEPGVCTLQISSSDAFWDTTGIVSTVCTLKTSVVSSTQSVQTNGERFVAYWSAAHPSKQLVIKGNL